MTALPLPSHARVREAFRGFGRAAQIRDLYAERCSVDEIALALGVEPGEVCRVLLRPASRPTTRTHWERMWRVNGQNFGGLRL